MSKVKTAIKVGTIIIGAGTAVTVGVKKLWNRLKARKNPKGQMSDLEKTFEAFKLEVTKSNEAALEAVRLMDELMDQMDDKLGVEPTEINCEIEEVIA